jgi:hypothetical protein
MGQQTASLRVEQTLQPLLPASHFCSYSPFHLLFSLLPDYFKKGIAVVSLIVRLWPCFNIYMA